MDVGRTPEPGFSLAAVCLIYESFTGNGREGLNMKQVGGGASDIYAYIANVIAGTVAACANRR